MKFENYTLVFCNGDPPRGERLRNLVRNPACIVCADGGAQKALIAGYAPDLVVGDLDSLDAGNGLPDGVEIVRVPGQDNTDFEKTLDLMLARGMDHFLVAAFSGGRIDQTLANIQIAYEYAARCTIALADNHFVLFPVTGAFESEFPVGSTVSIISMTDESVVSASGLAYGLNESVLPKGGHAVSNRSVSELISVTVHSGGIILMVNDA